MRWAPSGSEVRVYSPFSPLTVERTAPVSTLVTVTAAPATGPPDISTILPEIAAVTWA